MTPLSRYSSRLDKGARMSPSGWLRVCKSQQGSNEVNTTIPQLSDPVTLPRVDVHTSCIATDPSNKFELSTATLVTLLACFVLKKTLASPCSAPDQVDIPHESM